MNKKAEVATATIEKALTEYNIPDATMQALTRFKEAEKLECIDKDSRQIIGKHRADIKTLRPQVNTVRIALNKSFAEKNKALADTIESALNNSYDVFDKKIKAYDSVAEAKAEKNRVAKAKVEHERVGRIQYHMDGLELDCKPLDYGASKNEIVGAIENLHLSEISAVDFDTRTEEAEQMKAVALENAEKALESRIKIDAEQAEANRIAEENAAAAKKLADEQAAFKKVQDKAKADQKKKDDAAKKLAAQKAEKTRKANKKLEDDQKALEKREADFKAKEEAADLKKYSLMYDEATKMNWAVVNDSAVSMNADFDQAKADDKKEKKAQLKKDKARAKLIAGDQKKIQIIINQIDKELSKIKPLGYATDEGGQVVVDLYVKLKESLSWAETAGKDLV